MNWGVVLSDSLHQAGSALLRIAVLIVIAMIVIEALKESGWLEKISKCLQPVMQRLYLPGEAGVPVATALFIGLAYGAGVVIQMRREGHLRRSQLTLALLFIGLFHGMIEDTLIFVSVGGNGLILLGLRAAIALAVTVAVGFWLSRREQKRLAGQESESIVENCPIGHN
ncbi:MAG TPA: hypothetical protein GXZ96_04965 [Firmicutes bacterium]|jgi:hypothetical protein|nr:hypothetical protein [Bacillota bacterium]